MQLLGTHPHQPEGCPAEVKFHVRKLTWAEVVKYRELSTAGDWDADDSNAFLLEHGLIAWQGIDEANDDGDAPKQPAACTLDNMRLVDMTLILTVAEHIANISFLRPDAEKNSSSPSRSKRKKPRAATIAKRANSAGIATTQTPPPPTSGPSPG